MQTKWAIACLLATNILSATPSQAITYGFTGASPYAFTSFSCTGLGCGFPVTSVSPVFASISFNIDLSGQSGTFGIGTPGFTGGQIQFAINGNGFIGAFGGPPGNTFSGQITLTSGVVTDWAFSGSDDRLGVSWTASLNSQSESVNFFDDFIGTFGHGLRQDTISAFASDPAPAPLPAALPLFATGLGALSLVGWRRKRKLAA